MGLIEDLEDLLMYLRASSADSGYMARYVQDKIEVLLAKYKGRETCSQEPKES